MRLLNSIELLQIDPGALSESGIRFVKVDDEFNIALKTATSLFNNKGWEPSNSSTIDVKLSTFPSDSLCFFKTECIYDVPKKIWDHMFVFGSLYS
jgi:hypothetical protein